MYVRNELVRANEAFITDRTGECHLAIHVRLQVLLMLLMFDKQVSLKTHWRVEFRRAYFAEQLVRLIAVGRLSLRRLLIRLMLMVWYNGSLIKK